MLRRYLHETPAAATGAQSYIAYLETDDLDALGVERMARGAIVREAPADKPWRQHEMLIGASDGHRIVVGQPI